MGPVRYIKVYKMSNVTLIRKSENCSQENVYIEKEKKILSRKSEKRFQENKRFSLRMIGGRDEARL